MRTSNFSHTGVQFTDAFGDVAAVNALAESLQIETQALQRVATHSGINLADVVRNFEIALIRFALHRTHGVQTEAAKLLNLRPTTLNEKIKRYRIVDPG